MSPRYVRNPPRTSDDASAAIVSLALATGVGLVAFYFARLFFAREPMETDKLGMPDRPDRED